MQPDRNRPEPHQQAEEHPPLSFDTKGNFSGDWQDVRRAGFWVWAAITLIAAPTLPTVVTVMTSERRAGMDEAQQILQVFLLTFPLTLGVAIDAVILLLLAKYDAFPDDRPRGGGPYNGQAMLFGGLILIFALSASLGNWLGMGVAPVDMPKTEVKGHPLTWFNWLLALLKNYFVLYGPQLFFSSLLVGAFAGWAVAMKLLPNLLPASLKRAEERLRQDARARMEEQQRRAKEAEQNNQVAVAEARLQHEHTAQTVKRIASEYTPAPADDPNKLRQMLLLDLESMALRKRYLAVRTPFQRWLDDGNGQWVRAMVVGAVVGVILGFVVLTMSTNKTSTNPAVAALDRATGGAGLPLIFGLIGFFSANYILGRNAAYWEQQRVRGELGPLPPNAKGDLATLRKQFLGE